MGKWDSLKTLYPALPTDPTHAEALAVAAETWANKPLAEIAAAYDAAREEKEALDEELSRKNVTLEALKRVLVGALENAQLTQIRTARYSFSTSVEPYPTVKNKPALREWAGENMSDSLAIPWQTLKSVVKNALENGEEVPPGVEIFVATNLTRRKA